MLSLLFIPIAIIGLATGICWAYGFQFQFPSLHIPNSVSNFLIFACGAVFVPSVKRLFTLILRSKGRVWETDNGNGGVVYGLEHGRLNLELPPTMWMNMGYWHKNAEGQNTTKTLADASKALLGEIFATAGFPLDRSTTPRILTPTRTLIDLGFGCGDQTLYLMDESVGTTLLSSPSDLINWSLPARSPRTSSVNPKRGVLNSSTNEIGSSTTPNYIPLFDSYIGITNNDVQCSYARERVEAREDMNQHLRETFDGRRRTRLFCADAAAPEKWSEELRSSVLINGKWAKETWVLALDCMYHFRPTRWEVLSYAARVLHAGFLAFDLCLAEPKHVSLAQRWMLRFLTKMMGAPWGNFVTVEEYKKKLRDAGYTDIVIRDVSDSVFESLAQFLGEQDRGLQRIGLGLGKLAVAGKLFGWWGRSGIVRGVIVVARL
ncbi:hypothetical protein BCR34DRAFT_612655 [Clohesyomyces aquaticus]|uniref:S-adenosyl-L-methionine-dependent methyltransferase n=1 Tax=Clohesyomyces aquaticus TaxID=1231657 RepID=A0A1Y1ZWQ7_9PLEO|nr:hypothetical protein BCR34DRAFT_612655 [Clohesyomyces aquaticus]